MFIETVVSTMQMQRVALILNTVLLICALIAVELIYSEKPKEKRKQLYYFLPLILLLAGLLIYAAYKQQKGF
jgi:hypothetical protein